MDLTSDGLLALDEWNALDPIEGRRLELVDGVVIVSPRPKILHAAVAGRLMQLFGAESLLLLPEPEVVIAGERPSTVRVPDLVLPRETAPADDARFDASEVLLVIEIVSAGSRRTDYIAKRYDYAHAGIPYYWIVDPDDRDVLCLELADGTYRELPVTVDDTVVLPRPVPITVDWDQLLGRGGPS
ncbi:Uma2 family endonuclease [Microlunatus elymi]|nr:Uma2 family endonuclease [Microlunatus elymi]